MRIRFEVVNLLKFACGVYTAQTSLQNCNYAEGGQIGRGHDHEEEADHMSLDVDEQLCNVLKNYWSCMQLAAMECPSLNQNDTYQAACTAQSADHGRHATPHLALAACRFRLRVSPNAGQDLQCHGSST